MTMMRSFKSFIKHHKLLFRAAYFFYRVSNLLKMMLLSSSPFSRKWNYLKCFVSAELGSGKSYGSPVLLTIEPTNLCNLKCDICETGAGVLEREKKYMKYEEFCSIIDQFDGNLRTLFFYFMGEPFLNKDAYRMIEYAVNKGIFVSTCTNGDLVEPEKLVNSGIQEVNFQIAGMTQEVQNVYRNGSDLKKVFANLEKTVELRNSGNIKMDVIPGFILMKHNEHQVPDFISYCKSLGLDRYNVIGTCARTLEQASIYLPSDKSFWIYNEDELAHGRLVPLTRPDNFCPWIYFSASIMVNGDVVPCCRDPKGKFILGNVFNNKFSEIWNNDKYQAVRRAVAKNSNDFKLCQLCPGEQAPRENT